MSSRNRAHWLVERDPDKGQGPVLASSFVATPSLAKSRPTYRHLEGLMSLTKTDPSWMALLDPEALPGLSFVTSTIARSLA